MTALVPYQLSSTMLASNAPALIAVSSSGAGSARVKDDVVLGRNIAGFGEFHAERFGVVGAGRVDVGNRHMCSRNTLRRGGRPTAR